MRPLMRRALWAAVPVLTLPVALLAPGIALAAHAPFGHHIGGQASQSARADQGRSHTVERWGSLSGGLIPVKAVNTILSPAPVRLPGPVAQVATSNSTEYALLADGRVYAWGLGNHGQLGDGSTRNSFFRPVRVRFPARVKIAFMPVNVMPFDTALAVDTTGHVWGWGVNGGGELCLGNRQQHLVPVQLPFDHVTALAGAFSHAVYDSAGQVFACGLGKAGVLGNGATKSSFVPVKVTGLGPSAHVVTLVAAFANAGALLADGSYLDWGINGLGQLGIGSAALLSDVPVQVPLPAGVAQIAQGGSAPGNGQSLVLLTTGALYAWGANMKGQLGDGTTTQQSSPELITPPAGVTYELLASSGSTSYGVTPAGDVYSWGAGGVGQIGNGTTTGSLTPVKVAADATGISGTAFDVVISTRR